MNSHYLDLDDIFTTSELISATFEVPVGRMGYLNPCTDDKDLKKGTKLDLPFWLAQKLVNHEGVKVVTVDIPKQYKASYRNMYKADAESVDLQALGPNFYNLALKMPAIDRFQGRDIIESALQLYQGRFRPIMDSAQNASYKEKAQCIAKYDNVELALFRTGQESLSDVGKWEVRDTERIDMSGVVRRHGKRKRPADDI